MTDIDPRLVEALEGMDVDQVTCWRGDPHSPELTIAGEWAEAIAATPAGASLLADAAVGAAVQEAFLRHPDWSISHSDIGHRWFVNMDPIDDVAQADTLPEAIAAVLGEADD